MNPRLSRGWRTDLVLVEVRESDAATFFRDDAADILYAGFVARHAIERLHAERIVLLVIERLGGRLAEG